MRDSHRNYVDRRSAEAVAAIPTEERTLEDWISLREADRGQVEVWDPTGTQIQLCDTTSEPYLGGRIRDVHIWVPTERVWKLRFDEFDFGDVKISGVLSLLSPRLTIRKRPRSQGAYIGAPRHWEIVLAMTFPDRFTRKPVGVTAGMSIDEGLLETMSRNEFLDFTLRKLLKDAMTHEVDESLLEPNGSLINDPHMTDTPF